MDAQQKGIVMVAIATLIATVIYMQMGDII